MKYPVQTLISDEYCFTADLNTRSCRLSDFPDLCSPLADEGAALGGRHYQPQGDRRLGRPGGGHQGLEILLELGADQGERLEDGGAGPGHRHNPLWTGTIRDVDLGSALTNIR